MLAQLQAPIGNLFQNMDAMPSDEERLFEWDICTSVLYGWHLQYNKLRY